MNYQNKQNTDGATNQGCMFSFPVRPAIIAIHVFPVGQSFFFDDIHLSTEMNKMLNSIDYCNLQFISICGIKHDSRLMAWPTPRNLQGG